MNTGPGPAYTARRPAVLSKLDAYKTFVSERVAAAYPERPSGTVLLSELRALLYGGNYDFAVSILRPCVLS